MTDSQIPRHVGPKPRQCGCKGYRSCRLCIATTEVYNDLCSVATPVSQFNYCQHCKKVWQVSGVTTQQSYGSWHETQESEVDHAVVQTNSNATHAPSIPSPDSNSGGNSLRNEFYDEQGECTDVGTKVGDTDAVQSSCSHVNSGHLIEFEGIVIVENFVTEEEEMTLDSAISSCHFINSQSGRRKQDYGPKVNFKKQKLRAQDFKGLPSYSRFLYDRMKALAHLSNFEPVELCNLEYCQNRGAHIDAHLDDSWLWGERLVTLNLLSDSTLTFTLDSDPGLAVRVPLQRRSLIVVSSAARHKWKHCILPEDIEERRLAMTFRELSQEFSAGGSRQDEGEELLRRALTFEGCAMSG